MRFAAFHNSTVPGCSARNASRHAPGHRTTLPASAALAMMLFMMVAACAAIPLTAPAACAPERAATIEPVVKLLA